MNKSQFRSWCRLKVNDLRLRKVVEEEENEKDSWPDKSNKVNFELSDFRNQIQRLRMHYDVRNSERYEASRNSEVRKGI